MKLSDIYSSAPVPIQEVFTTTYGLRERSRRHQGRFRISVGEMDARQWWSPAELERDQSARIRSMVTWCAARVPYYQELFAELSIDPRSIRAAPDLEQLPVLEKETVRSDPTRFLSQPPGARLVAQSTGGTTGTPLRYWATIDAVRANYATYESRTRKWAGVAFGQRMASFHGQPIVPQSQIGGPYWRRNPAFNQLYFSVYHLNDTTISGYINRLARFSPEVIAGYTSAIHRIARGIIEAGAVGRVCPTAVLVSSEMLTESARADMELAFGCRVTNSYSLGELVAYVSECEAGDLHVSTDYGVVELLDLGSGTEIIATGLINKGMPLLRYRTGDLASESLPGSAGCRRGLPVLAEITGRVDDVIRTPEGGVIGPAPMSLAFQRVANLRRAQVRQDSIEKITVVLEVTALFGADDEQFLLAELRRRLGPSLVIQFEYVEQVPRTSGGKERLVLSTIPSSGAQQ